MKRLLNYSVKEALDHLPDGICFFNKNGTLILCNHQMYRVFLDLTGKDLQSLQELRAFLEERPDGRRQDADIFLLEDGHSWKFTQEQIATREGSIYTQVTASDVTEIYLRQKELEKGNQKLEEDSERIRRLSANMISLIRKEEILSIKIRVHDDIGRNLIATRQLLKQKKPIDTSDFTAWKKTIRLLKHENDPQEKQEPVIELTKAAHSLGIQVFFDGIFPEETTVQEIFLSVIRECMTNAAHHARAKELYVCLTYSDDMVSVCVTNSGALPAEKIVEGGGLTSLRTLVKQAGGIMKVGTVPRFELIVSIPVRLEQMK
ncbi:MAG: PAS domain-containing protein [Peptoniphilaceae bacterium]|nr:PAS domain-containing protein [Peptoniphilaceae bacterium]MDD7434511.1 PAS domain-containing protein [Peptoniphilaceae bacterium]MDD7543106.1 PAS domain-containing protein [Peptoniphilaceae bacterium]MDY3076132.1 PAS domain-containing protein [Peptoniphilaceae bacterium]MDY4195876.1 PAS domain-containing protein [Peptoniphilaceae bacterium]